MVFLIKKPPERADRLRNAIGQRGTPRKMLAGSWISDLAALGKAVVLCETCARKWIPAKVGYIAKQLWPGAQFVLGDCDGCGHPCQGTLYVPERGKN